MPFIPHTEEDVRQMLEVIGASSIDNLFDEIPAELRIDGLQKVPSGIGEMEVSRIMQERAVQDGGALNFIGAGAYEHHIPAAVWEVATRGEFYSAYTPYQAEASQGTLQLLYEYQTMMASLMGMDVSNASLYDGASALAEAILMAVRANRGSKFRRVLVPGALHPVYRKVAHALTHRQDIELIEIPFDGGTGLTNIAALDQYQGEGITAVVINQPNFFGQLEATDTITDWAHASKALVIAVVNPLAMSLLKPPGQWGKQGADIACGEGQPLGAPLSSGGPYYGFMTCKQATIRQMPGRIVGRTVDMDGKLGYALTLQAREQHIRRSKATSNICTNQGLVVTASTIYMSIMGAKGLQQVASACHSNLRKLIAGVQKISGVRVRFAGPAFHEVVLELDCEVAGISRSMSAHGIQAGYDLVDEYPGLQRCLLVCVTETKTDTDINKYIELLERVVRLQSEIPCPVKPKFA